jgi:hypothetical protein
MNRSVRRRRAVVRCYLLAVATLTGASAVTVFHVPFWLTMVSIIVELLLYLLVLPLQRALGVEVVRWD